MNEQDIEQQLKKLLPRETSPGFKQDLLRSISDVSVEDDVVRGPSRWWIPALAAAAAVLLAVGTWMMARRELREAIAVREEMPGNKTLVAKKGAEGPNVYTPTLGKTILVSYEREPFRVGEDSFSRHRYHMVDCMEWKNKQDGSRYRVIRPRKETVILQDDVL